MYSNRDYADMYLLLGASNNRPVVASRLYAERYPNRRHPSAKVFRRLDERLRTTGQLQLKNYDAGRPRTTRTPHMEEEILAAVRDNPRIGIRSLGRQLHIHPSVAGRVLKSERWHPYHFKKVHTLLDRDYHPRVNFCHWLLNQHNQNADFISKIMWTDEAIFTQDGVVNCHNLHYWAQENPHLMYNRGHQVHYSFNVWAGIIGTYLIGPHIIPNRLDGRNFRRFLNVDFQELIEDLPLNLLRDMWIQLDGAPPHWERTVREWLDTNYPNRWIGRDGPFIWPARSPDLNPLDYFFWGYMKDIVYETPPEDNADLLNRIFATAGALNAETLARTTQGIIRRAITCIDTGGRNFEQLL